MRTLPELGLDALAILDNSPALTYVACVDGPPQIVFVSRASSALLGFPPERFTDNPGFLSSRVHPDDLDTLQASVRDALVYGSATRDRRLQVASGQWRWFRDNFRIVRDAAGKPLYGVGSIVDVSDEKSAQAALEARTSEYRILAEHSSDLITRTTFDGRFIYQSPSAVRVMGLEPEARRGQSALGQMHVDDLAAVEQAWRTSYRTRTPQRLVYRSFHADGRWVGCEAVMNPVIDPASGKVTEFVIVSRDVTQRIEAERGLAAARAELRERGELYELFANRGSEIFLRFDIQGNALHVSPSHERILGRHTLVRDGKVAHLVHPDDMELATQAFRTAYKTKRPVTYRHRYAHENGGWVWLEVNLTPLVSPETGEVTEYIAAARDVGATVEAEQRLQAAQRELDESRAQLRLVTDNMVDVITLVRPDGKFAYMSPSAANVIGYSAAEMGGQSRLELVHPDDVELTRQEVDRNRRGEVTPVMRYRVRRKDGVYIWVERRARLVHDKRLGDAPGVLSVLRDVTADVDQERLISEAWTALEESRVKLKTIIDNSVDVIAVFDEDRTLEYLSASCVEQSGYTADDFIARRVSLTHPDDERIVLDALAREDAGGEGETFRYRGVRKDGETIWLERRARKVYDPANGRLRHIVTVTRDISDEVRREKALQDANAALEKAKSAAEEANAAKSRFLATMSHELRTPMTGVMGMLDLLKASPLDAEQARFAQIAYESADSLLAILNDILDFSKVESGELKVESAPFVLRAEVEKVTSLLMPMAHAKGDTLAVDVDGAIADKVVGDAARLRQILFNLVGNAIKFTAEGLVALRVRRLAGGLRFEIRDTGCGIPESVKPRLFRPFVQADGSDSRKAGGTGLGLAISKALVTAMGGTIGLESQERRGSLFWVELPLQRVAEPATPAMPSVVAASSRARRSFDILVAEDHPVNQQLLAALLKRDGHAVTIVANGQLAVEAVQAQRFDVVLMDVQMPVLDGPGATRAIRALPGPEAAIPIVAVTANALRGDREAYLAEGMTGYVSKPIRIEALREALEAAVPQGEPARLAV